MATITKYLCENRDGQELTDYFHADNTLTEYEEAKAWAWEHRARVVAHEYEFSDSEMIDDYTLETCSGCGAEMADDESREDCDDPDLCVKCNAGDGEAPFAAMGID